MIHIYYRSSLDSSEPEEDSDGNMVFKAKLEDYSGDVINISLQSSTSEVSTPGKLTEDPLTPSTSSLEAKNNTNSAAIKENTEEVEKNPTTTTTSDSFDSNSLLRPELPTLKVTPNPVIDSADSQSESSSDSDDSIPSSIESLPRSPKSFNSKSNDGSLSRSGGYLAQFSQFLAGATNPPPESVESSEVSQSPTKPISSPVSPSKSLCSPVAQTAKSGLRSSVDMHTEQMAEIKEDVAENSNAAKSPENDQPVRTVDENSLPVDSQKPLEDNNLSDALNIPSKLAATTDESDDDVILLDSSYESPEKQHTNDKVTDQATETPSSPTDNKVKDQAMKTSVSEDKVCTSNKEDTSAMKTGTVTLEKENEEVVLPSSKADSQSMDLESKVADSEEPVSRSGVDIFGKVVTEQTDDTWQYKENLRKAAEASGDQTENTLSKNIPDEKMDTETNKPDMNTSDARHIMQSELDSDKKGMGDAEIIDLDSESYTEESRKDSDKLEDAGDAVSLKEEDKLIDTDIAKKSQEVDTKETPKDTSKDSTKETRKDTVDKEDGTELSKDARKENATTEKDVVVSARKHKEMIERCMAALHVCLSRFPTHFKSLYRLAYVYTHSPFHKVHLFLLESIF